MRKDWDSYFMDIALMVKERSTCPRKKVGALIVKDRRIKSTGYNGSPRGEDHCEDVGCLLVEGHCKRTIHAEVNAILESSPQDRKDSTIYVTTKPCFECQKVILGSGISRVVYLDDYEADFDFLSGSKYVKIEKLKK